MKRRSGVAATLVSFVVFTILLLGNFALYSAEQSQLYAAVITTAQIREQADSHILLGLSAYDSLDQAQSYLQGHALDCTNDHAYLQALAANVSRSGSEDGGIVYTTDTIWTYLTSPLSYPTLYPSFMSPDLRGYVSGDLDLSVTTGLYETHGGLLPTYSIERVQQVHLPVPFDSTVQGCQSALSSLGYSLGVIPYCNASGIEASLSVTQAGSFSVGATAVPSYPTSVINGNTTTISTPCHVDYWASLTMVNLEGVDGTYSWTVHGEGSLDVTIITTVTNSTT